jgi:hypothetical protein
MNDSETIVKESSMKTVVFLGIGKATLEIEGCSDVNLLYPLKEQFIKALERSQFDIHNVETVIREQE